MPFYASRYLIWIKLISIYHFIKVSYICHRAINQKSDCQCLLIEVYLRCRFSQLFPFTVSITLLYVSHWPQSRVCHYKVFQLSIQYAHWTINVQPSETYIFINLINPLRLLSSWHLTHLLCFNSVLRVYDLRPVLICTLESLTSTSNL